MYSIGIALTIIALILAIWQIDAARTQLSEARRAAIEYREAFELIRQSLSTQYIGPFPDNIPEIIEMIREARNNLTILCDVPGYGHFSSPRTWFYYKSAIEEKIANGVSVTIICYSEKRRNEHHEQQFQRQRESWYKQSNDFADATQAAVKDAGFSTKDKLPSKEEFKEARAIVHSRILKVDFRGARIVPTELAIPMNLWIIDDDLKAVVSFQSNLDTPSEHAFLTSDARLTCALRLVSAEYLVNERQ